MKQLKLQMQFDLRAYIDEKRQMIDSAFERWIEAGDDAATLFHAMDHSLTAGGKRLRPILCLAACEAVGTVSNTCISVACALEMVHTYSLIHDDLPAMDNDELRRGKPTCHVAFNEATAILAGDALLTLAFEVISAEAVRSEVSSDLLLEIVRVLAKAAGCRGMIEGQMQDIAYENTPISVEKLERMHRLKTGALIRASVQTGAILGGATEKQLSGLVKYAENIGLAFQVTDDILNVTGDPMLMGKAVGTDSAQGKNTYPALLGLEPARNLAQNLIEDALQYLEEFDNRADPLRALARYITQRKR
jgi:geranylgeranyl diphosphate synthase, type II